MKTYDNGSVCLAVVVAMIIGSWGAVRTAKANGDWINLARVVEGEGNEYVRLRDALLDAATGHWDVTAAADQSWECGLAAFILNERLADKESFDFLDAQHPRLRADMSYYRLSRSANANVAFLVEKMWKAPAGQEDKRWAASPEKEKEYAYETLVLLRGERYASAGETALWKTIWKQSGDDRFRHQTS